MLGPSAAIEPVSLSYPQAKVLYLPAIKEQVPVFEGKFLIVQDIRVSASKLFIESLGAKGKTIQVSGELKYQACDKTICYPPALVPVTWQLQVLPLDVQRSPESIRHK